MTDSQSQQKGADALPAAPQTTEAVREALKQIRHYCDENLGPSRSGLLNKIAKLADDALSTPSVSAHPQEPVAWCQPMDRGKHTPQKFMIYFDDPDHGIMVFDNEPEAREAFTKKNTAWNCYLFGTLPLYAHPQPQQADGRGAVIEENPADEIMGQIEQRFPDWRGFRDLVDCIDVTLHRLRGGA